MAVAGKNGKVVVGASASKKVVGYRGAESIARCISQRYDGNGKTLR